MKRLLVASLLLLAPATAAAQSGNATAQVTALVVGGPISFLNLQDLNFGTVPRGSATIVAPNAGGGAKVRAAGTANAYVQISFTLPTQLANIQAVPGINMPISFANNSARYRRNNDNPNNATPFNPNAPITGNQVRFGGGGNPYLFVYLGGTVNPSPTQAPGIYRGSIILTITYL